MSTEIKEHQFVHSSLDELLPIIRTGKADPSQFDAPKMKGIMERLKGPLVRPRLLLCAKRHLMAATVPTLRRRGQSYLTGKPEGFRRKTPPGYDG